MVSRSVESPADMVSYKQSPGNLQFMTSTYIAQIGDGYRITLDKSVLIKEGLALGDFVELTVRKIEKTAKSESGSPYST